MEEVEKAYTNLTAEDWVEADEGMQPDEEPVEEEEPVEADLPDTIDGMDDDEVVAPADD